MQVTVYVPKKIREAMQERGISPAQFVKEATARALRDWWDTGVSPDKTRLPDPERDPYFRPDPKPGKK